VGPVGLGNSLVGSNFADFVGGSVRALTNGNYVVGSLSWRNEDKFGAGAVTWCNGNGPTVAAVSPTNSLVGSSNFDRVGLQIEPLPNGNYLVRTPDWDNGDEDDAGAVTWANGNTGITGTISAANSLIGTAEFNRVGNENPVILTNGNYVVLSSTWDNNGVKDVGAATWGNGTTGIVGPVSASNSLVGTKIEDRVGKTGIRLQNNGNYVIGSFDWDNGSTENAGAATWGNGATGISGPVTSANSLVGTSPFDAVGSIGSFDVFPDGNYAVRVPSWDVPGGDANVAPVVFGNGAGGTVGPITPANSGIGTGTVTGIARVAYDNSRDRIP
jgi:hypothetical protein